MKLVNVSTLRRHLLTLSDKYLKTNNFDGVLIVDDCIGVIDKMPEISNKSQEWISVNDRLPDNYIHKHGAYKEFIVRINRASCATTLRYDGKSFYDDEFNSYNVTHWMPLPEPPKENK